MAVGDWEAAVAALGPLLWWKLDEASGTTAADASGNGRTGTYGTAAGSGAVLATRGLPSSIPNSGGSSATFPGGGSEVFLLDLPWTDPSLANVGTLACTFRSALEFRTDMLLRSVFGGGEIRMYGNTVSGDGGTLWVQYKDESGTTQSINTGVLRPQLSDDRPHLIVMTWGSSGVRVYFDGVQVGSNAVPLGTVTSSGDWRYGIGPGRYDDFVVFGTELSAAQVVDLRRAWGYAVDFSGSGALTATGHIAGYSIPTRAFFGSGTLSGTYRMHMQAAPTLSGSGTLRARGAALQLPELVLEILDPTLIRAPTALTVVVGEAWPDREIDFYLDGRLIWTGMADTEGYMAPTSINVPERSPFGRSGRHVLRAEQPDAYAASATFTLQKDPAKYPITRGPDAQAVDVPGAVRPNGTRAWVLQDLMPVEEGGIGSYVMPYNPSKMTSPHLERAYTTYHTTLPSTEYGRGGQHHVMQGGPVPKEWTFEGYCPTKEMHEKLKAYKNLNRRFYIIDHRKRAWKVAITSVELTARLHQTFNGTPTDWGHDYVVTATVFDQAWVNPA